VSTDSFSLPWSTSDLLLPKDAQVSRSPLTMVVKPDEDKLTWLVSFGDTRRIERKALDARCDELSVKDLEHSPSLSPRRSRGQGRRGVTGVTYPQRR
jgi:hypothetical protein